MKQLLATFLTELLILWRDRAGLAILFVMPVVLVVIITLIQENVFKMMATGEISIVLLDRDGDELGRSVKVLLEQTSGVTLVTAKDRRELDAALRTGAAEVGLIVPVGTTLAVHDRSQRIGIGEFLNRDDARELIALLRREMSVDSHSANGVLLL